MDTPLEAPLIPKLRGQFAEFLDQSSPERLRILTQPTCVSLRYGCPANSLEGISREVFGSLHGLNCPALTSETVLLRIYLERSLGFGPSISYRRLTVQLPIPHHSNAGGQYRNINLLSIVYACRPRLRFRLTLGGFAFPRKP